MLAPEQVPSAQLHWYQRPLPPPRRPRRYCSSVVNNVWNAWGNWADASEHNPAGILQTMKVQTNNLAGVIAVSPLYGEERMVVLSLIGEVQQALNGLNPALLNQQAQRTSARATLTRVSNDRSQISSNAKAALGVLRYLGDGDLFPGCAGLFGYIQERMQQVFAIMDGDMTAQDVAAARQQQQAAQASQQAAPVTVNPDGYAAPYTPAAYAPQSTPQTQQAGSVQGSAAVPPVHPEPAQTPTTSPVAGLQPAPAPWGGTPNTTSDGNETVGSRQDWFSTYGTTPDQFAARCSRWMRAQGGGQAALVTHLRSNGVPENVISQTLPCV